MKRREFITLLGGAAVWSLPLSAQQSGRKEPPVVGFLYLGSERGLGGRPDFIEAFRSGLAALGYIEGQNIRLIYGFAEGRVERLSELTTELVSRGAKIIVTSSTTAISAAHKVAPTIPIVSWASADPVAHGWAQSLARPGGMITGMSLMGGELFVKSLELLKQVRPQATTFAVLFNATNPGNPLFRRHVEDAASQLGIKVHVLEVKELSELAEAFRQMTSLGVDGLYIIEDPVFNSNLPAISQLALQHRLPTVSGNWELPNAGGLFARAFNYIALVRRSAWYVDRILKGEAPGELPIEQPTEFKLIVNLKTAKALGLTIPPEILARTDEVIE